MIHVAILLRRYLNEVASGRKSIECRLTRTARAPFEQIEAGERIYFKESSGPFALTAVADHVLFAAKLTPSRVMKMKRVYNHEIRGDDQFWRMKRNSRYVSLIWLRDVEPIRFGPTIRPLQGVAWLKLPDKEDVYPECLVSGDGGACVHSPTAGASLVPRDSAGSFAIPLTAGNLRNRHIYTRIARHLFPPDVFGGATKKEAGNPIVLKLDGGPEIETDIVGARGIFRARTFGAWFESQRARPGDCAVFTPIDSRTFFVSIEHRGCVMKDVDSLVGLRGK